MVRAALAQLSSVPGDSEANARRATALLADHPAVDLAVFPELFLVGYDLSRVEELALPVACEELRIVAAAAAEARTAVVIGFAEHVSRGRVANSAALIGADGVLVGIYRKTHLFGDERRVFVAGDHCSSSGSARRSSPRSSASTSSFPSPLAASSVWEPSSW